MYTTRQADGLFRPLGMGPSRPSSQTKLITYEELSDILRAAGVIRPTECVTEFIMDPYQMSIAVEQIHEFKDRVK